MKAHPALFEGEGEPKIEVLLFQSTVDIHFQNVHKTLSQSTVDIHFQNAHKTQKTAKANTLCVYFIHHMHTIMLLHYSRIKFLG